MPTRRRPPPRTSAESANVTTTNARWSVAAIVLVLGLAAYWPSTGGPFVFDDNGSIVHNSTIRNLRAPAVVLSPPRETPVAGRPLVNLTFAANYAIDGLNPRGYHVANIALHLLCALLIFGLVARSLSEPLAFAAAAVWVVHPLITEAVDYVTQRTELLMATCFLLTLYASARALDRRSRAWQAAAIASCALGMASKEAMVTAPFVVVLWDRCFAFPSFTEAFRARWRLYAGLAATWMILASLMATSPRTLSAGFSSLHVSPWSYLLEQTRMITRYLRLAFWPNALVINYGWAGTVSLADVWPYALLLSALAVATIVALVRWPKVGFVGAWFFITLAPASSIVPVAAEVGAERRMYLALMAVVVLVVLAAARVMKSRVVQAAALGVVVVALGAATWHRHREYASALELAETTLARWPTPVAYHMVGTELAALGRRDEAIAALRQAVAGYPPARYNLGQQLLLAGHLDEGIAELREAARIEPALFARGGAEVMIGQALATLDKWPEVAAQAEQIESRVPGDPDGLALRALAAFKQQDFERAVADYRAYLAVRPNDPGALGNFGIALMMTGQPADALAAFRRVVDLDGTNVLARLNLARALSDSGHTAEARLEFERVLQIDPRNAAAQQGLKMLAGRGK